MNESANPGHGRLLLGATAASIALCAIRLHVARGIGFGDSEALYASYALHPQPAYLDHPGLVGSVARWLGRGLAPTAELAHLASSVLATLVPWLGAAAVRASGGTTAGALRTALALVFVPELAIGLFGLTPDLLLATLWLGALTAGALALRAAPSSRLAFGATLGAAALVGLACLAKVSAVLLGLALLGATLGRAERSRWRTAAPWAGLGLVGILLLPVVHWEIREGYPMLTHRLIATQTGAGFSLRNLAALIGGQLAYVTPPFLFALALVAVDLRRSWRADSAARLLWLATLVPLAPLVVLCLWSRVAEPHWLAPAFLGLAVHFGRGSAVGPKLARACVITGGLVVLVAWAWVKTPLAVRALGASYQPRYDLANDLYAWGPGNRMVERAIAQATLETRQLPVVVGPHWIVCAQLEAALGPRVRVGCNTPGRDDFDRWYPRERWLGASNVIFVHDSRFDVDPELELPGRSVRSILSVEVRRGGRVVRTIWATHLERNVDVGVR